MSRQPAFSLVLTLVLIGSLLAGSEAAAQSACETAPEAGSRPRDLAVSPDGDTIVVSSEGSDCLWIKQGENEYWIDVRARSWNVEFSSDGLRLAVTLPWDDRLLFLKRPSSSSPFHPDPYSWTPTPGETAPLQVLYGYDGTLMRNTSVLAHPSNGHFYIAHTGKTLIPNQPNRHIVWEVGDAGYFVGLFFTEREPSALALSPDGGRLFVGTIQGGVGGAGLGIPADPLADLPFDGGTVVSYDTLTRQPVDRFLIGSPVRGMSVVGDSDDDYRLYFTHLGDGAQGEDPEFGGRKIPNAISALRFETVDGTTHEATSRQNYLLREPVIEPGPYPADLWDLEPEDLDGDGEIDEETLACVVPDAIAVGEDQTALWVSCSASGVVARIALETDGSIRLNPPGGGVLPDNYDLLAHGEGYKVVTGKDLSRLEATPPRIPHLVTNASAANSVTNYLVVEGIQRFLLDAPEGGVPFSSRPLDLARDDTQDQTWVVTQFGESLHLLDPTGETVFPVGDGTSIARDERRFFTAGAGFDFREIDPPHALKVNNISCSTCHVSAHIDGKVRITRLEGDNAAAPVISKLVAVPSMRDSAGSEWLFFEGLKTTVDIDTTPPLCGYCTVTPPGNGFFPDTNFFEPSTAVSPYAANDLGDAAQRGRWLFDDMQCSRCHNGTVSPFVRTTDTRIGLNGPVQAQRNLLHDATQVFITDTQSIRGAHSLRNMSDVGTRPADEGFTQVAGVNTPALAGSWNHPPYLHDGRYASLEEVLEHTWVDGAGLAAPAWTAGGAPENFANDTDFMVAPGTVLPPFHLGTHPPFAFNTHAHARPGSRESVREYLGETGFQDVLAFLRGLSAETDPLCTGGETLEIGAVDVDVELDCDTATVQWSTNYPVEGLTEWNVKNASGYAYSQTTPLGKTHTVQVDTDPGMRYKLRVSGRWCRQEVEVTRFFNAHPCGRKETEPIPTSLPLVGVAR